MDTRRKIYISLGSNKGDRLKNLQDAINFIFEKIGKINIISKVYNSPAFGFEGSDFLNCCVILETDIAPDEIMLALLEIETSMGRVREANAGYESRTIDLDILFVDEDVLETKLLKVPHPELHKRKFVLKPLLEIAPKLTHPTLHKNVADLLETCEDTSVLEPINIWLKNPSKQFQFSNYNYIAIEGNIGAGKTSLATMISKDFNAKLILERFAENPFLPKFYEDAKRYAFTLEMSFLADRYQQISDDLS